MTLSLGAEPSLRDVHDAAGHIDPQRTRRHHRPGALSTGIGVRAGGFDG